MLRPFFTGLQYCVRTSKRCFSSYSLPLEEFRNSYISKAYKRVNSSDLVNKTFASNTRSIPCGRHHKRNRSRSYRKDAFDPSLIRNTDDSLSERMFVPFDRGVNVKFNCHFSSEKKRVAESVIKSSKSDYKSPKENFLATSCQQSTGDTMQKERMEKYGLLAPGLPIGFVSGFLGSMAGIGGAVFAIPLLCKFARIRQRIAAGTTLFAVFGTAASSAFAFHQAGQVDHGTALNLALVGLITAPIGAHFSNAVNSGILRRSLGVFLMFISPLMFLRLFLNKNLSQLENAPCPLDNELVDTITEEVSLNAPFSMVMENSNIEPVSYSRRLLDSWAEVSATRIAVLSATGGSVGFLSGFLGVSGGTLFTPMISLVGCCDGSRDFHKVLGTSFMAMTFPAVTGGIAYALKGSVRYRLVPSLFLGTVFGAAVGSRLALKLPDDILKVGMALVFSFVGYRIYKVPLKPRIKN
eukprot:jgi/Galph1/2709/GphlegSOOS_G1372.1